ncbi:putative D-tyrosyl-tRNA(Tyr) deacylase 2 [Oryzias melastigma]|uniref:THAP domain-containing protein 1 n=1 Tax=Oryzias melastigma TaxID=30732 RepID=A0A834EXS3_ORYME|nr:putative D-tyrosyl-tRNA(Tyr) deacylase 2 [Oryzias melastigma]
MPSFAFLDNVELYIQTGTYPANSTKSTKCVIRTASKKFIHKDGALWRVQRGRLLRVVRSDEEIREILTRHHDNNHHPGQGRLVKEIVLRYYWVGVTVSVKKWVEDCAVCQGRSQLHPNQLSVQCCLVYGCDASSYAHPELSFHRFPKDAELRRKWLALAQRDEASLRAHSCVCSRHFEASCFTLTPAGRLMLSSDAVPTLGPDAPREVPVPSDEDFHQSSTLEDVLCSAAADAAVRSADGVGESSAGRQEHEYCLAAPSPDFRAASIEREDPRSAVVESIFITYNHIARYLSTRVLPMQSKQRRAGLKRMAMRFGLIDGVLMYTRVSPPLKVPRSREEVNSILQQFHDNHGHYGEGICQRQISRHFYWATLTRDLRGWISSCHTCLNRTKRKWLRCSVYTCSNCCGPVERGLGLTFHKFPFHNPGLLAQWVKVVGRSAWHPRLWSSVCSIHFTESCFDHSGEKPVLRPDAVPSLLISTDSSTTGPAQLLMGEEAFFAKYDAVELYLSSRIYPPGLTYVEKNTFRRFCKKFSIKDGKLYVVSGEHLCLVLRSRLQVQAALLDYHNELNHLDVNKCLRLLNERFFWKSMRLDVVQWINSCALCSRKSSKRPHARSVEPQTLQQALRSPQLFSESERDCHTDDGDDDDEEEDGGRDSDGTMENQWTADCSNTMTVIKAPPPGHLTGSQGSIILQPRTASSLHVSRLSSDNRAAPARSEASGRSQSQPSIHSEGEVQPEEAVPPEVFVEICSSLESTRTPPCVGPEGGTKHPTPEERQSGRDRSLKRRRRDEEGAPSAPGSSTYGLDPVVVQSAKPWPVFTIGSSFPAQTEQHLSEADSPPVARRLKRAQARMVVQQCSHAKVMVRPALDGADAQWVEIQQGMVVYVCFFHGASEEIICQMAHRLMSIRIFRRDRGQLVSLLELPGSVLLVHQESLLGELLPRGRMQFKGGCELWWGAQLFSNLATACTELMAGSAKCRAAGVKVEQGVYGEKQEMVLSSVEPTTLMLEF